MARELVSCNLVQAQTVSTLRFLFTMKTTTILTLGILAVAVLALSGCESMRAKYESAPYTSAEREGAFEIRDYPELTVVRTSGKGSDANGAFMRLFRYISGGNASSAKIAMTTPVFMDRADGEAKETDMSFVVPNAVAAAGAPAPNAPQVSLSRRAAGRFAVMRFSGYRSAKGEEAALAKLRVWMTAKGLKETGRPSFAYFDPPWTLGPFRRNEVLIRIGEGK
jgi:DNA gyrase inhibitor GyrI